MQRRNEFPIDLDIQGQLCRRNAEQVDSHGVTTCDWTRGWTDGCDRMYWLHHGNIKFCHSECSRKRDRHRLLHIRRKFQNDNRSSARGRNLQHRQNSRYRCHVARRTAAVTKSGNIGQLRMFDAYRDAVGSWIHLSWLRAKANTVV